MSPELDDALVRDFPRLYRDRGKPRSESCMAYGFSCDDGWEPIIRGLSMVLESLTDDHPDLYAAQVKEKWGGLRFYLRHPLGSMRARYAILVAECACVHACELCGAKGRQRRCSERGRIKTVCDVHAKELGYE